MGFQETLKSLSDPITRDILLLIKDKKVSAGEITGSFNLTGATISHHLKTLKNAELIFEEKQKNFIYYQLNTSVFEEVLLWITEITKGDNNEKNS